jgi:hypothetical protein
MDNKVEFPLPPPLWTDQAIESAVYEVTYQGRTSDRVILLVRSKLMGIRNGYQKVLNDLFVERREARALLDRAYSALDLAMGDDDEIADLHKEIRDFLTRRIAR